MPNQVFNKSLEYCACRGSSRGERIARRCERFVLARVERRESFAVETTLRTTAAIDQAELARKSASATEMHFVATDSIAENVARLLQRSQAGGRGASERDIRAIHQASVENLREAMRTFGRVVYDSTARWTPPRLAAVARGRRARQERRGRGSKPRLQIAMPEA